MYNLHSPDDNGNGAGLNITWQYWSQSAQVLCILPVQALGIGRQWSPVHLAL